MPSVSQGMLSNRWLLLELSAVLCDGIAGVCGPYEPGNRLEGICRLDFFLCIRLSCFLLEAAECGVIFSQRDYYFFNSFNSIIWERHFYWPWRPYCWPDLQHLQAVEKQRNRIAPIVRSRTARVRNVISAASMGNARRDKTPMMR